MQIDPAIHDHQAWLGYLQPDGLVVSPAALVDLQVFLPRDTLPLQERFKSFVEEVSLGDDEDVLAIPDFINFVCNFLGWPVDCLVGLNSDSPVPDTLQVPLPEFGETLAPSFAFKDPKAKNPDDPWILLVQMLPLGTDFDATVVDDPRGWSASQAHRFERLLRETRVPIGLISNGTHIRLIYAPHGENSGSITFPVSAMTEVAGRPILAAFDLLLNRYRLLAAPSEARLPALLAKSREYQSRVSAALAQQVLDSLYELMRGFQAANEHTKGELLHNILISQPDHVYSGLITVLMRLVFLLYSEERGLMPGSSLYVQHYSVHGLFEKLHSDNERYPDTMDNRYGAWVQLLALFRIVYNGSRHPQLKLPARRGHLFDPDRFPFLEGRTRSEPQLPLISDGVIYRILQNLLILNGERLSYRTLDVEEIGSVYQTIMGFRLELTKGPSIAIIGKRKHKNEVPAPMVIDLNELLTAQSETRNKWLREKADQELSGEAEKGLKSAANLDDLLAALDRKIARNATPYVLQKDAMVIQPTDERRRTGSHYTPRSLTQPIVRTTLKPILDRMGEKPTPEQILDLKICDLAVGSGAFLVEACRQLGDELVKAWHNHGNMPVIPPDEDEVLHARRLIAQRCLYGLDRNPMAADLAKLSLWLVTLAKDHPFTFLDHAIRCGDSLVGLTRKQIADFHWKDTPSRVLGQEVIEKRIQTVSKSRKEILDAGDFIVPELKRQKLDLADQALNTVREAGDLVIAAYFGGDKDKTRQNLRDEYLTQFTQSFKKIELSLKNREIIESLRSGERPVAPFHWEIEFPEVFDRENGGFDAIIGNPPFGGHVTVVIANIEGYTDWLRQLHPTSTGKCDVVAHFFRRAFNLIKNGGNFGLIATNTIGQGDTRASGLRWICQHEGEIYAARKRLRWPGLASVVVSVVHVIKGSFTRKKCLDDREVEKISAFLFHRGGHDDPVRLVDNVGKSFQGSIVLGMGFTFDDTDTKSVATPLAQMRLLIERNPHNQEVIFPYIGGEEINSSPTHGHHRYVINFGERSEEECRRRWPDLMAILEEKVKPERLESTRRSKSSHGRRAAVWWQHYHHAKDLYTAIAGLRRVLVINCGATPHLSFAFLPVEMVFANTLDVISKDTYAAFCALQSRPHEVWVRFFASSMKDDLRYTPSDCFETFPFPKNWGADPGLEVAGKVYYEFRAELMARNNEGLTKTYNRFHDPEEPSPYIIRLRELHATMDRAVLDAYGWHDIPTDCEFILDYEEEDDEEETGRRKKKPWRYRWPDPVRDEVLARLLALNAERAEEERIAGLASSSQPKSKKRGRKKITNTQSNAKLFPEK